jgi:hypothetical protein
VRPFYLSEIRTTQIASDLAHLIEHSHIHRCQTRDHHVLLQRPIPKNTIVNKNVPPSRGPSPAGVHHDATEISPCSECRTWRQFHSQEAAEGGSQERSLALLGKLTSLLRERNIIQPARLVAVQGMRICTKEKCEISFTQQPADAHHRIHDYGCNEVSVSSCNDFHICLIKSASRCRSVHQIYEHISTNFM